MKSRLVQTLAPLALVLMAGLNAARLHGRSELRAPLPLSFAVNNRVFPAGEYSFEGAF